eukprot:jgi/Galph1/185/GphlegSOOS_G4976.1
MASEGLQVETRNTYPNKADGYQLIEPIGQGESAVVYRAWCGSLQEEVAIKIVDLELFQTALEEISKEIQVMSLSSHPNVVPYCTSFVCGHDLWVVMPLLAGGDVKSLMDCSFPDGMDEPLVQYILNGVLRAIQYFHENGQIHRNIKAANILLTVDGRVMLSDYGLVGWMVEGGLKRSIRQTFVGTPCWMAPEVLEQTHGYDYKADIWSFGITALELAQGRAPYSEYPPMKILLLTLQGPAPSLKGSARQRFSKTFHDLVSQCLQKDPNQRPTASQLLEHRFFKSVKKPGNLADIIAKSPPLGRRSGNQRIMVQQILTQPKETSSSSASSPSYGWNFDLKKESDSSEQDKKDYHEWNEDTDHSGCEPSQVGFSNLRDFSKVEDSEDASQNASEIINKLYINHSQGQDAVNPLDEEKKNNERMPSSTQDGGGAEDKNSKMMTKRGRFVVIEVDQNDTGDHRASESHNDSGRTTPLCEEHSPPFNISSHDHSVLPLSAGVLEGSATIAREVSSHRIPNVTSNLSFPAAESSKSSNAFRRGRFEVKEVEERTSHNVSSSRSRPQSPSPRLPFGGSGGPLSLLVSIQWFIFYITGH